MTHIVMERNDLRKLREGLPRVMQERTEQAMGGAREVVRARLDDPSRPSTDTAAGREAMIVQSPAGDDSAERIEAARSAFLSNDSRFGSGIHTPGQFEQLCGAPEPLPGAGPAESIAALAALMAYLAWWEIGHQNRFTRRYEHAPFFESSVRQWATTDLAQHFTGVLQEALQRGGGGA